MVQKRDYRCMIPRISYDVAVVVYSPETQKKHDYHTFPTHIQYIDTLNGTASLSARHDYTSYTKYTYSKYTGNLSVCSLAVAPNQAGGWLLAGAP